MRHSWLVGLLLVAGCAGAPKRVDPVPDSAWRAAEGSPRTNEPVPVRRRDPARPPSSPQALTREQVLAIAGSREPQDAIAEIDRHPLAFPLTKENLGWFEDRVAPPELVDYLRKRAAIDWDALAKAPPAETPRTSDDYPVVVDSASPQTVVTKTVYVEQPTTTVIYERDPEYYAPTYYGGIVYVGGAYYPRSYYRSYGTYYSGGTYYGGGTYYAPTFVGPSRGVTVQTTAPPAPAGLYGGGAPSGLYYPPQAFARPQPQVVVRQQATATVRVTRR